MDYVVLSMYCRSWEVIQTAFPHPFYLPEVTYRFNDYLAFDLNLATLYALVNWIYYFALEPTAAVSLAFDKSPRGDLNAYCP